MKLQVTTKEQRERIEQLLCNTSSQWSEEDCCGLKIEGWLSFDEMAEIVDYLRQPSDKKEELFEECWIAYRRKGSKKKSYMYWRKLNDDEKESVLKHIKVYVSTRESQFQKDFERYLRDKTFKDVVYDKGVIAYDPTREASQEYLPQTGGFLLWNDVEKQYVFIGMFLSQLYDGYTDDDRPDGATIMLNNARGFVTWNAGRRLWVKR